MGFLLRAILGFNLNLYSSFRNKIAGPMCLSRLTCHVWCCRQLVSPVLMYLWYITVIWCPPCTCWSDSIAVAVKTNYCHCRVSVLSVNEQSRPQFLQSTGVKLLTLKKDEVSNLCQVCELFCCDFTDHSAGEACCDVCKRHVLCFQHMWMLSCVSM